MRNVFVVALLLVLGGPSAGEEPPKNLLANGSFEETVAGKDLGWDLGGKGHTPLGWSLNRGYHGMLTVIETDAAHGARCVEVLANAKQDAQIFRPCPAIRPGTWYRISLRVRLQVTLLVYEYGPGKAPKARVLGSMTAPRKSWGTLTGFYTPKADGFRSASIAVLVPQGQSAWLDDVRVEAMDGPLADPNAPDLYLGDDRAALRVSGSGRLTDLSLGDRSRNLTSGEAPQAVLTAQRDGVTIPVSTLTKKGSAWVARFPDAAISVRLRPKVANGYFQFELLEAKPRDVEAVTLRFPVLPLAVGDAWMPGTYDDSTAVAHMGLTPNTHTRLVRRRRLVSLEARWTKATGFKGGRSALIVAERKALLPTVRRMAADAGLPVPMLPSSYAPGTATQDWARVSPVLKQSYLFVAHLGFGDIDKLIEYAREAGFGLIMLHRKAWRASAGHEEIARTAFPEGLSTLAAVCRRIHAAGLGVGLHLYGPAVSTNDAYVTPVPDKRLFSYPVGKLAKAAKADATELVLRERPPLRRIAAADLHPGNLLRLGDEIIRWKRVAFDDPPRITGCERGVFGTKAKAHKKHATVRTLVLRNGGLLVDPDSDLPQEMGAHLARVVNATQADLVYFDALAGGLPGQKPESWYYLNKVLLASCAGFDHGVIVQTGMGPGRQLAWHLVPRSASANGHGDLKRYLDGRMAGIRQMRKTHVAADIGWYALDIHGRPDELEYVCAKALALDASISVQAHKPLLESHPRAREVFDMIGRWERLRLSGAVPESVRTLIAQPGREVRALANDDGTSLWEAEYDTERVVLRIDDKANVWDMKNARKEAVALGAEIRRARLATTPALHTSRSSMPIDDLISRDGFVLRDDKTLAKHILLGGRADSSDGFARRGVRFALHAFDEKAVGGRALELKAWNRTRAAGWGGTGKTFAQPLDLSTAKALGLWVKGDGKGASLVLTLADAAGVRVRMPVTLDYAGWRFQSFEAKAPKAFDWSKVAHVLLELAHVPPQATVAARVAALRAVRVAHAPPPMPSVTVIVGRREVDLNVELKPGQTITLDALGRGIYWRGGMQEGIETMIAGGPLVLPPGWGKVGVKLKDPSGYAGDLRVRFHKTWPLKP